MLRAVVDLSLYVWFLDSRRWMHLRAGRVFRLVSSSTLVVEMIE